MLTFLVQQTLLIITKILVGAQPQWIGVQPSKKQRVYYGNHTSHVDTVSIWAALPERLRRITHPVAAKDYWDTGPVQRFVALKVLNAIFIDRERKTEEDPLAPLCAMLDKGESLIIFPEGKRNADRLPQQFKSGIYFLAQKYPHVEFVPVYLDNLHRCMPRGSLWPVPITCTVRFGAPVALTENEDKAQFLGRARNAIVEIA